jgi:YD repeat-containing protein
MILPQMLPLETLLRSVLDYVGGNQIAFEHGERGIMCITGTDDDSTTTCRIDYRYRDGVLASIQGHSTRMDAGLEADEEGEHDFTCRLEYYKGKLAQMIVGDDITRPTGQIEHRGELEEYGYDRTGLRSVRRNQEVIEQFDYDTKGRPVLYVANGIQTRWHYDTDGRCTSRRQTVGNRMVGDLSFEYDSSGILTTAISQERTHRHAEARFVVGHTPERIDDTDDTCMYYFNDKGTFVRMAHLNWCHEDEKRANVVPFGLLADMLGTGQAVGSAYGVVVDLGAQRTRTLCIACTEMINRDVCFVNDSVGTVLSVTNAPTAVQQGVGAIACHLIDGRPTYCNHQHISEYPGQYVL